MFEHKIVVFLDIFKRPESPAPTPISFPINLVCIDLEWNLVRVINEAVLLKSQARTSFLHH